MRCIPTLAASVLLALPAAAQQCGNSFVEGFDGFSNVGAWGWTGTFQASLSTGGNPAWHVRSQIVATPLPVLGTQDRGSYFAGDWRARGVTSIGVDFHAFLADAAQCGRPLTLRLSSDAGTPGVPADDRSVLFSSLDPVPCPGSGWRSYAVDVPSQATLLPPGWKVERAGGLLPAQVWDALVQDVTQVQWLIGDPALAYPTTKWQLGADNARIAFLGGPTSFCIAQPNSAGCSPAMLWKGVPSVSQPLQFLVRAFQIVPQVPGLCFYGYGATELPVLGGTLCVTPPIRRTPAQPSGGSAGCTGSFTVDFNVWIQSGIDPGLVAGATAYAQYWSRDPASATGSSLTNAVRFTICP
jgi:hypothetical protein